MRIDALHRRLVERAGQIIHHRIEQRLHALVLECRSADDREDLEVDGGLADAGLELGDGRRFAFQELLEQNVVGLGDDFDQLHAEGFGLLLQVGGNGLFVVLRAHGLVVPDDGLHLDQVDDALEIGFRADGNLQRHGARAQPLADGVQHVLEVRAVLVHLVDEADAGNLVLVALPPHRLGLRLHAGNGVEQRHRAVQHAQRPLHFGGEVHVARSVDDVDAIVLPHASGGCRRNRDAAFLLLLHVVHGRGALMHFADAVRDARVEQDALCRCRFSGVDVRHDSDIPATIQRYGACHSQFPFAAGKPAVNPSLLAASFSLKSPLRSPSDQNSLVPPS